MTTDVLATHSALYRAQGGRCAYCGTWLRPYEGELAHRIPQRKHMIRKYGAAVIHHPDNLAIVCRGSARCNSAMSIGGHPMEIDALVRSIRERMEAEGHE